jgi:hypothetical protein
VSDVEIFARKEDIRWFKTCEDRIVVSTSEMVGKLRIRGEPMGVYSGGGGGGDRGLTRWARKSGVDGCGTVGVGKDVGTEDTAVVSENE